MSEKSPYRLSRLSDLIPIHGMDLYIERTDAAKAKGIENPVGEVGTFLREMALTVYGVLWMYPLAEGLEKLFG